MMKNNKKKIAFYIESMVVGGAERALLDLANNLDNSKFEITIVRIFKKSVYQNYQHKFSDAFSDNINDNYLINNNLYLLYRGFNWLYNKLNKAFVYKFLIRKKYDIEVAFYEGLPTEFVSFSTQNSLKIAWLHADQKYWYSNSSKEILEDRFKIYDKFDRIVGVSSAACNSFKKFFPPLHAIRIFNIVDECKVLEKSNTELICFNKTVEPTIEFVVVARLVEVKGYKRLLKICNNLKNEGFSFHISILGEGTLRDWITSFINENRLDDYVTLLGNMDNPYPYIKGADCLICGSFFEGFGISVLEAMILDTPVIATDCGGTRDILEESKAGILCDNTSEAIQNSIRRILNSPTLLDEMRHYTKGVANRFSKKSVLCDIDNLFNSLIEES